MIESRVGEARFTCGIVEKIGNRGNGSGVLWEMLPRSASMVKS